MAAITGLAWGASQAVDGEAFYRHLHPSDVEGVRTAVSDALRRTGRIESRFRLIRPDTGQTIWLEASFLAARDSNAAATGIVGVVKDVSAEQTESDQREALVRFSELCGEDNSPIHKGFYERLKDLFS